MLPRVALRSTRGNDPPPPTGAQNQGCSATRGSHHPYPGTQTVIFGISTKNFKGTGSGLVETADDKELRRLCEATGGQIFLPSEKIDLFKAFTQVAQDLRQEYVIYYRPTVQEKIAKRREIKLKLVSADGHLSYKEGYTY